MAERIGEHTITLSSRPTVWASAAVVGKKEGEGPLARHFDAVEDDVRMGEASWEQAESAFQKQAVSLALNKAGLAPSDLQVIFAGDLLNQCTATAFGLRDSGVPLLGQYGACSTMAQTLAMASIFVDGGAADVCAAVTSSHFCSAERQFRFPLAYGGQRPPTSQWTATAAGCAIVGMGRGVHIREICVGRVVDLGITDANNMGAAMAPADGILTPYESEKMLSKITRGTQSFTKPMPPKGRDTQRTATYPIPSYIKRRNLPCPLLSKISSSATSIRKPAVPTAPFETISA